MASPLPSAWPNSGSRSLSWCTSAPSERAISAVASVEAASTTRIWSISGPRPQQPLDDRADRVGHLARRKHDRDGLALALEQLARAGSRRGGSDRSRAAYYGELGLRRHENALGRAARNRARRAARDPGALGRAAGQHGAAAGRSPPGARSKALQAAGIEALWSHQADALEAVQRGPTMITSGTASGKSLAFNLPVLHTLAGDPSARALYLYPTKALAQDQARKLSELGGGFLRHAIYDGDTPREERRAIRQRSNLILTNPDMLHVGVLPNHRSWGDVLANLAFVVVDEAHVYRGVFGSHVANVLRRLRRLARAYGTEPRFVLTSATIANPAELAERLTGLDFELVDGDGAPRAERRVAIWNPPLVDERSGQRASALSEAAGLLAGLVEDEVRTICFLKSRRGVELIQKFARLRLEDAGRVRPRRADRPLPRRLHGGTAARDRAPAGRRRPAGRGGHRRARARHRRRRARRRDVRDLPRHGGEPAPDVGPRRAARHGARPVRGRRRRARPVLLPPPRRVPRPAGRVGDPRPRVGGGAPGAPAGRGLRAAADPGRRRHARAALGGARRAAREARRAARARRPLPAAALRLPGRAHPAALGVGGRGGRGRGDGRGGDRHGRDRAGALGRPPRRRLPAPGLRLRGRGARPGRPARAGPAVLGRLVHAAEEGDRDLDRAGPRLARDGRRGAVVRHRLRHRAGDRLPAQARLRPRGARLRDGRPARAAVRDPGALVRAARRVPRATTSRSTCSRARCTPPSTRRSPCCR